MKNKYSLELVNTTIPFAWDDSMSLYEFIGGIVERFNKFADILDHEVQKTVTEQVTKELGEFTEDRITELIRTGQVVEVVNQAVMDKLHELAVITPEERNILDRAFDLAEDIVPRLEGLDVPLLENVDSEIILARGTEPTLGARLDGTDADYANQIKQIYDGEYIGEHLTTGNIWVKYNIVPEHKYYIQKTSSNGGIVVRTVNAGGSYDYIDDVNNGSVISTTSKVLFIPNSEASYFVVYANEAVTWKIWDANDITLLNSNIASNTNNITSLQARMGTSENNISLLKNTDIKNFSEMLKIVLSTSNKTQYVDIPLMWERGGIFPDTGLDWEGGILSARTLYYSIPCDVTFYMKELVAGKSCTMAEYDSEMQFIAVYSVPPTGRTITLKEGYYYRFSVYSNSTLIPIDGGASDYFLIQMVNPLFEGLPSYYTDAWLDDVVERVRDGIAVETGCAFAYVTDMHMTQNSRLAHYLIEYISNKTGLNMTFCGGDIPMAFVEVGGKLSDDARESVEISISQYNAFESHLRSIGQDVFYCKGNHDFNIVTSSINLDTGWTMPNKWIHQQIMGKNTRKVHGVSGKNYYYIDDDTEKIRYVVIDQWEGNLATDINNTIPYGSGHYEITAEQYEWLSNTAFNVDGYTIVIFCHASPDPNDYLSITTTNVTEGLFRLIKALKNKTVDTFIKDDVVMYSVDYSSSTSELACVISGHSHKSFSRLTDNVLTIVTSGDSYSSTEEGVTRTKGTVTENAIDVFGIDTTARTIKAIRVGGGYDREWSY